MLPEKLRSFKREKKERERESYSFCILQLDTIMFRKSLRRGNVRSTRSCGGRSDVEAVEVTEKAIAREEHSYTVGEIGVIEAESIITRRSASAAAMES